MDPNELFDPELLLAAEDFPDEEFEKYHTFAEYEDGIIRKLIAHGPVLLRGGRGSGKSALLKEAFNRINKGSISQKAIGIYISLRYLPLLRYQDQEYERFFCKLLIEHVKKFLETHNIEVTFDSLPEVDELQKQLINLSIKINRRIVLYFDDAAHIGRETSLKEFFDIFRTLSCSTVSCKAAIYPGVTEFGTRFDLMNDANVVDIARNHENQSFTIFFRSILEKRFSKKLSKEELSKSINFNDFAAFLGRAVIGNVRAFIYACNYLSENKQGSIGLPDIEKSLKYLASEYYWPLLEELKPKLGSYEPLIDPASKVAETLYNLVSDSLSNPGYGPSCIVHRDHIERMKKVFEILEYAGFVTKLDSSRAMKSGGRGTRYALNLCNIIEKISPSRLTSELFFNWLSYEKELEIFKGGPLENIDLPDVSDSKEIAILGMPIEVLQVSKAYPYGITENKINKLKEIGIKTVGELADRPDEDILAIEGIGEEWLKRIRNVVGQAIWM